MIVLCRTMGWPPLKKKGNLKFKEYVGCGYLQLKMGITYNKHVILCFKVLLVVLKTVYSKLFPSECVHWEYCYYVQFIFWCAPKFKLHGFRSDKQEVYNHLFGIVLSIMLCKQHLDLFVIWAVALSSWNEQRFLCNQVFKK